MTWVTDIFKAGQANTGGVVRRSAHSVEEYASVEELIREAKARGFHVIETGDQFVILCHEGAMMIHC